MCPRCLDAFLGKRKGVCRTIDQAACVKERDALRKRGGGRDAGRRNREDKRGVLCCWAMEGDGCHYNGVSVVVTARCKRHDCVAVMLGVTY